MNNHSGRISKLEQFRWYLLGGLVVADVIILYALALWQAAKAAGK
jgi:cytochrome oxidase assembly protein ShyY1